MSDRRGGRRDHGSEQPPGGDWGGLEGDRAIAIGLLAELTQLRQAVEALAYGPSRMAGQRRSAAPSDQQPEPATYHCTACDETVTGARAAQQHTVDEHKAPGDGETWQQLLERVDDQEGSS